MSFQVIYRETDTQVMNADYNDSRQWVLQSCDTMPHADQVSKGASETFWATHQHASRGTAEGNGYRYFETIVSYGRNYGSGDIIRQTDIYITVVDK